MGKARAWDPPLEYAEIDRVYRFTTKLLERLGMSEWRVRLLTVPASKGAYADIRPLKNTHVGELRLCSSWMAENVEAVRIETLIHEMVHLTHYRLTGLIAEDLHEWVGYRVYRDFHPKWEESIEMWTDHMTQVLLGLMKEEIEEWAAEIWGLDWRDLPKSVDPDV